MVKSKKVKVTAILEFEIDKKEVGHIRLWGVDFTADKGVLTAEMSVDDADAMKAAKRVK